MSRKPPEPDQPAERHEDYEPPEAEDVDGDATLAAATHFGTVESDRDLKTGLDRVDPDEILEAVRQLPITTWSYRKDDPRVRHIGPMAQDFAAAFGVGDDDRHIHHADAIGVALAAIQALAARLERAEARIAELTAVPD